VCVCVLWVGSGSVHCRISRGVCASSTASAQPSAAPERCRQSRGQQAIDGLDTLCPELVCSQQLQQQECATCTPSVCQAWRERRQTVLVVARCGRGRASPSPSIHSCLLVSSWLLSAAFVSFTATVNNPALFLRLAQRGAATLPTTPPRATGRRPASWRNSAAAAAECCIKCAASRRPAHMVRPKISIARCWRLLGAARRAGRPQNRPVGTRRCNCQCCSRPPTPLCISTPKHLSDRRDCGMHPSC
jgi:hypothetical protein